MAQEDPTVRSVLTDESIPVERPEPSPATPQGMCLDKGYDYDEGRELLAECGFTAHIRARGEEAKALKQEAGFKARRWVVERTQSWMTRFRRILIRWDKQEGVRCHAAQGSSCVICRLGGTLLGNNSACVRLPRVNH